MQLNVGRIGRAHGILGEATIEVRTDEPERRFAVGAEVLTESSKLIISSARVHNGILLLGFKGISDRNAIEKLRDTLLYAEVDINEPGVDEDDYHVQQLIGLRAELEDGSEFGLVADVLNLPAQDCLAIKTKNGEVLIPFVRQLVPIVDLAGKRVVVIPPVVS
ncbi:MAG: ribosome maturation factor RimM [Candidatus Nanopelagicaceae bacterium]